MTNPNILYNFSNLNSATERALRLLGKTSADDNTREHIQELLLLSAATKLEISYYRPYLVAAILLSQDLQANQLIEADNVKFKDKEGIVLALLNTQRSIDASQAWEIPTGFSVADIQATAGISAPSAPLNVFKGHVPVKVVW